MVIDIIIDNKPTTTEVVKRFHAKVKDVKPTESWLITVPGLNEEANTLVQNLNISHTEGITLLEAVQAFQTKSNVGEYVER